MTNVDYIQTRIEMMKYEMLINRFKPESYGYTKPAACNDRFKPIDRNSRSLYGSRRHQTWPTTRVTLS